MSGKDKKTVGIGVVGTGFMCRSHANACHKAGYLFWNDNSMPKLVGVAATSQAKADEAAQRYGFAYGSVGWEKLLEDPKISLIDVCVGDAMHKQVSI